MDRDKLKKYLQSLFGALPMEPMQTMANVTSMQDAMKPPVAPPAPTSALLGGDKATIGPANPLPPKPVDMGSIPPPVQDLPMPEERAPETPLPAMPATPPPTPMPGQQDVLGSEYNDDARKALYDNLRQKADRGMIGAAVAGFGDTIANAYGGQKQHTMQDTLERTDMAGKTAKAEFEAGRKGKMEEFATNNAMKKVGREEQEYKDANDPNSAQSKFAVAFATKMLGPEKVAQMQMVPGRTSYADVSKVLPIVEKYVAHEDAKAKNKVALEEKQSQFNDKATERYRNNVVGSPVYKNFNTIHGMAKSVRSAMADPSAYGDLSIIYGTIKGLDAGSTVREGEVGLMREFSSLKNSVLGTLQAAMNGQKLTPQQKQDAAHMMTRLESIARDNVRSQMAPTLNQARRLGLQENEIAPDLGEETPQQQPGMDVKQIGAKSYKKVNGKWYEVQ